MRSRRWGALLISHTLLSCTPGKLTSHGPSSPSATDGHSPEGQPGPDGTQRPPKGDPPEGSPPEGNPGEMRDGGPAQEPPSRGDPASPGSPPGDGTASPPEVLPVPPGITWQWQLSGPMNPNLEVELYDLDLFETPPSTFADLKQQKRRIICYFSAGSRENYRDDANRFLPKEVGATLEGWPEEQWLDIRSVHVRSIMLERLDLAAAKGCDGVEPDNVDGYQNDSGFPLTRADQLEFNRFIAHSAHARGLSVGLKNAVELAANLVDDFDWALVEECLAYDECSALRPFLNAGKAVLHVEYVDDPSDVDRELRQLCPEPSRAGFSTLVKMLDLGPEYFPCP